MEAELEENPAHFTFPHTFYYYDNTEEKKKQMTVTEEAWNKAIQMTNENTEPQSKIKMLAKLTEE